MVVVSYSYNELHSMIAFGVGFRLQTREKEMQYIPITLWSEATILLKLIAKMKFKKSESLQTEGRHFMSAICKLNDV